MEPLTTSAMIGGIVAFLGSKLSKDQSINSFFSEFTEATVNWIKPVFLKDDGTEKDIVKNLKEKPDSPARKKAVETAIEVKLEDNPESDQIIKQMFDKISKTEEGNKIVNTIINSIQTITGNVTGNVTQNYNDKT